MEIHDETTVTQSSRCRTEMHTCRQGLFRPVWAEEILQLVHECGSSQAGSAVQIFHPTACCSCGRRMLWMCPRHIFHDGHIFTYFFKTLLSFHLKSRHPQVSKAFGSTSQHVGAVRAEHLFSAVSYRALQHS